jgi:hypothetical protein
MYFVDKFVPPDNLSSTNSSGPQSPSNASLQIMSPNESRIFVDNRIGKQQFHFLIHTHPTQATYATRIHQYITYHDCSPRGFFYSVNDVNSCPIVVYVLVTRHLRCMHYKVHSHMGTMLHRRSCCYVLVRCEKDIERILLMV